MHLGEPSAHDVIKAVHPEPVQNDEFPVASFIAVLMPLRQAVVSDTHTEPELMTAYAAPACAAALTVIRTNIPDPRSVTPSVKVKKIGAKMAASTAAVAVVHPKRRRSTRIIFSTIIDRDRERRE